MVDAPDSYSFPGLASLDPRIARMASQARDRRRQSGQEDLIRERVRRNQSRLLAAFCHEAVAETDFNPGTGYGLHDGGREKLERIWVRVFGGEKALVRHQIVSGTHALAVCLRALLRPGQILLSATGAPYDTLRLVIGVPEPVPGSLADLGVGYREVLLQDDGNPDLVGVESSLGPEVGAVFIQRSRGYSWRPALSLAQIKDVISRVRACRPEIPVLVDNCYGEFVEVGEPPSCGADLTAGSLIKNPGGGLAHGGGYVVGRKDWVQRVASFAFAPGLSDEMGPTLDTKRAMYQGLFMAPHIVGEALLGAVFAAELLQEAGFLVSPMPCENRHDIVQMIGLPSRAHVLAFCQGIQSSSPVDSNLKLVPSSLPGYQEEIIMGCGTFIQGGSLELSADAPLRRPFAVYMQGGLTSSHVELATTRTLQYMWEQGLWEPGSP